MDLNPSRITANPEDPSSDLLTSCEQARDELAIAAKYHQPRRPVS
jgi:hypothetical protein